MKTEDFERLKAVCEKEGFEVGIDPFFNHLFKVKKKDIWDGVEYFSFNGFHNKIMNSETDELLYNSKGDSFWKDESKPSTESAYVEQLKKEAFDRFGEIKEGDRFINTKDSEVGVDYCWGEFEYDKTRDLLVYGGCYLYQQGKWATKVKERVKVSSHVIECLRQYINTELSYNQIEHLKGNGTKAKAEFLAQQLEKYLNDEV